MSCSDGTASGVERFPGTGCCGSSCSGGKSGCLASEPRIRSCMCQENVGCLDRADCGGFRPRGTAATGACPGPCQCAEEEAWNRNVPPKPNCEWLSNFSELRRQWSDHGRKNSCKCCSCAPSKKAAPCSPCLPPIKTCMASSKMSICNFDERLSGGACGAASHENDQRNCISGTANSCEPCAPAPRPILKPRSCCQCIDNYCMCQPMPRTCNCPPPVQVDARAERECSCECPSSPECACPPSERKFPKTKVRCPNAKLCYPTPRRQPGPKCNCAKCQPCLPPPCDPCTSTKCRPPSVRVQPCLPKPPCSPCSVSQPCATRRTTPSPPCVPGRPQTANRSDCLTSCRGSGQSVTHTTVYFNNSCEYIAGESISSKGTGGVGNSEKLNQQCRCGNDARGCADECKYCCSVNCGETETVEKKAALEHQCNCSYDGRGCANDCHFCCAFECDSATENNSTRNRISAGSENKSASYKYSNQTGGIIEEQNVDEPIESTSNIQHLQDSQLKDLQTPIATTTYTTASSTPKRSSRLLQSLIRSKSSKT